MSSIKSLKNEGLKKIFAAGQGRKQRKYDEDAFGKQERDMETTKTAAEVFCEFAENLDGLKARYANLDDMDIEMIMDAAIDQIAQCIPAEAFEALSDQRMNGYGLND